MKKLTAAMLLSLIICTISGVFSNADEVRSLTDKIVRIHVIANSDSEYDQTLKLTVRDAVLNKVSVLTDEYACKEDALSAICGSLDEISAAAQEALDAEGNSCPVICTLEKEEFDKRVYDDFTLPAGEYDSLCIRIGEAKGRNWWCVCYPSLCVGTCVSVDDCGSFSDDELIIIKHPEKVRYKLWCFELVRKLKNMLS